MSQKTKPVKVPELTPLLKQFVQIKEEHPDHVLFFRCGDFYEMFFDDAITCNEVLGITLTSRGTDTEGKPVPLAGIPYHSVEPYLAKMIRAGYRVAICEQTENPKNVKGIVRREVVRVVTPGTVLEDNLLTDKSNNYLAAVVAKSVSRETELVELGLAVTDFSTGEFLICEFKGGHAYQQCATELTRLMPSEVIIPSDQKQFFEEIDLFRTLSLDFNPGSDMRRDNNVPIATVDPASVTPFAARQMLLEQFGVRDLNGFGAENCVLGVQAAAAVLQFLKETQRVQITHVNQLRVHYPESYMTLDATTQRSLELVMNLTDATRRHTLFEVLDKTSTAMGGRMLRQWILQPLRDTARINARLDVVESLKDNKEIREAVIDQFKGIADLERIISRAACKTANGRDILALRNSLSRIEPVKQCLQKLAVVAAHKKNYHNNDGENNNKFHENGSPIENGNAQGVNQAEVETSASEIIEQLQGRLNPSENLLAQLDAALVDNPPVSIREGGLIKPGYHSELDELRLLTTDSKSWIAALRQREADRSGITNLKVGYNRVFGYYLEVSQGQKDKVPAEWIRKQTLANAERYVTPELKEKEEVILHADERANELEFNLFEDMREHVCREAKTIQENARILAEVDCLVSLAQVAQTRRYVRPRMVEGGGSNADRKIYIRDGRHPVLESLKNDFPFVPNDTLLTNDSDQILLITGPNMAGKSTYIRQVALIVLMAHMGGFVPATEAEIATVDRIFTRVGAMDQLAKGQSTFLVEMSETANILNNATDHSLVILDEIGRGTSTYDGLSIAWSVVEYLHNTPGRKPKTLFATHYHELAELEGPLPRVKNYNVAVHEEEDQVAFLYRILRGHTDHSYGIYAAQVAGLPRQAVDRAKRILSDLEKGNAVHVNVGGVAGGHTPANDVPVKIEEKTVQLTFFDAQDHPALEKLRKCDINSLTPLQALSLLAELKQDTKG